MKRMSLMFLGVWLMASRVNGDPTAAYQSGASLAQGLQHNALRSDYLKEGRATAIIPNYTRDPGEMNGRHPQCIIMNEVVRTQLGSDRPRIDPNTDPIFVNANRAIETPEETLQKQTVTVIEDKDYEEKSCIDTRDDEFEVVNTARIDPFYKRFEVWQFYNHCPNHRGWGKAIAQGCQTWQQRHLMRATRHPEEDYDEVHGTHWIEDKHPECDSLLSSGKCRLKQEMPKEEGRMARMIPVEFYKKAEVYDDSDWEITPIDEHREGRSRLQRPADFGVESFVKVQVFICSYQSPGNTCTALRAQGGIELTSRCRERVGSVCVTWQKRYKVPKRQAIQQTKVIDITRGHQSPFNLNAVMNNKNYADNKEAPEAIAKLQALHDVGAAMPKINTGDPNALSVFRGDDNRCVSQAGNNRCPGGHGHKETGDLILERKWQEGKCIRVGTYEEKNKNIGQMIGQKRTVTTFCCFESILSKVLHQGAIDQGVKTLGDPKTPNCAALTLGQLQALDWDRVDFTPFVAEMVSRVNLNAAQVATKSARTVQSHLSDQMTAANSARMREQAASAARGRRGVS